MDIVTDEMDLSIMVFLHDPEGPVSAISCVSLPVPYPKLSQLLPHLIIIEQADSGTPPLPPPLYFHRHPKGNM